MSVPFQGAVSDGEGSAADSQTGGSYSFLAPWYVRGWSAQLNASGGLSYPALIPAAPAGLQYAPFPADQAFTNIRQYYFSADADPLGGFLTFMPAEDITITEDGVTWRLPRRLAGSETYPAVDSGVSPWAFSMEGSGAIYIWRGVLFVKLFATGNPNVVTDSGQPLTYHVREHFLGGREFDITVPASSDVQDLSSLIVPGSVRPHRFDPVWPMGTLEDDLYAALNGTEPSALPVITQSSLATDYIPCTIDPQSNAITVDPTSDQIYFAFMQGNALPGDSDWHAAVWVPGGPPYVARLLVGPDNGGLPLAKGQYMIWSKLVDFPQTVVELIGILYIQ